MVPGCASVVFTVTARDWGVPAPHVLFAVTETNPDVLPATVVMEVVDDVLLHPEGKVHV